MRFILLGMPVFFLAGCVLPPAVAIGSYAADGLSFLITGKSVSDHAISEVVGEDCATWRMVKLENPCREYEEGEGSIFASRDDDADTDGARDVAAVGEDGRDEDEGYDNRTVDKVPVTLVTDVPIDSDVAPDSAPLSEYTAAPTQVANSNPAAGDGAGKISIEQISDARPQLPTSWADPDRREEAIVSDQLGGRNAIVAATPKAIPASGPGDGILLVMGSFSSKSNAQRLARAQADFDPVVIPARIGVVTYYRVVTRTSPAMGLRDIRQRLSAAGIRNIWRIRSCGEAPGLAGCVVWTEPPRGEAVQVAAAG